jgi:putative ABC transport system permease protein
VIAAAAVFMVLVPLNMASTIAAPEFVTYMGIGESRIRIDIRQTGDMETAVQAVMNEIGKDSRVTDCVLMRTGSYKTVMPDGNTYNLMIESGDHGRFPVRYVEGRYPEKEGEIALSVLNAKEMNVNPGDIVQVYTESGDGRDKAADCTVCGIYSDVTNGGKTAKACFGAGADRTPAMWSVIYLSLADESLVHEWVSEYQEKIAGPDSGIKVTEISDYLQGTYGQTIRNIRNAAVVSGTLACLILFVVILLFVRLVIWKERRDSSLKKALGFVSADIRKEYLKKVFLYVLPGLAAGVFAGIVPGQSLAGLLMGFMGAYGFRFMISPALDFAAVPAAAAAVSFAAAWISLREVNRIRAYECFGSADGK